MLMLRESTEECNIAATRTQRVVKLLTSAFHPHKNKRIFKKYLNILHAREN